MEYVTINLRGTVFTTFKSTLQGIPNTVLSSLSPDSEYYNTEKNEYFFDRNPAIFHNILDYYKTGILHIPFTMCPESAREEFKFWGIPSQSINKCCWKMFYQMEEDLDILDKIMVRLHCAVDLQKQKSVDESSKPRERLRERFWRFLTDFRSSKLARAWHYGLTLMLSLSILVYILQTHQTFRVERTSNGHTEITANMTSSSAKLLLLWNTQPHPVLSVIDIACNAILTLELILRMVTCPSKKAFWKNWLNVIDLVSCLGIWVYLMTELLHDTISYGPFWTISSVLGFLYSFRILRVLRLVRYNCGMQILLLSVKSSSRELGLLACAFACFTIIFSGFIYVSELRGETFPDMFISMWWAVITMTTVGYGDHVPTTSMGFVVGTACAMVGILLIALPVAITSSTFHDFYRFNKYRLRHTKNIEKNKFGLPCSKTIQCSFVKVKPIENVFPKT